MSGVAVWVDERRCKACDICVSRCPAGVLAMRVEPSAVLGKILEVVNGDFCIGCRECENSCPDFAIFVADKGYKFAKLSQESREISQKIKENGFYKI